MGYEVSKCGNSAKDRRYLLGVTLNGQAQNFDVYVSLFAGRIGEG